MPATRVCIHLISAVLICHAFAASYAPVSIKIIGHSVPTLVSIWLLNFASSAVKRWIS